MHEVFLIVQHLKWEWLSWGDPFIAGVNLPYFLAYYFITVSSLSGPDRCVSRVGTAEVLDQENEEYEIRLVTDRLQEERYETRESHEYAGLINTQIVREIDGKFVNPTNILY